MGIPQQKEVTAALDAFTEQKESLCTAAQPFVANSPSGKPWELRKSL